MKRSATILYSSVFLAAASSAPMTSAASTVLAGQTPTFPTQVGINTGPNILNRTSAMALSTSRPPIRLQVPAGCAMPKVPLNAFYVDVVNGNDTTGNGSEAKPWKTLTTVLRTKVASYVNDRTGKQIVSAGVVKGGDVIYLKSGNYGSIRYDGMSNTDFLTIAAAPRATPVIEGWTSYGATGKLIFKGLTFKKGGLTVRSLTTAHDIIIDGNSFTQGAEAANWTPAQWNASPMAATSIEGTCTTHINNVARFIGFGYQVGGDKALLKNNVVDFYNGDGIRFWADNTTIVGNVVANHYGKTGSANHNDAMQGWKLDGKPANNLVIDSNVVIESTAKYTEIPPIPTGNGSDYTQGISIFDGIWNNITATNNVIIGSAYHGLSFYGAQGGLIANNVVISAQADGKRPFWIKIANRKDGVLTKNVVVRNNIANGVLIDSPKTTISDHNLVTTKPADYFVAFDRSKGAYDFHLKPNAATVGAGLATLAPTTDITGAKRITAMDAGAYDYRF